MRSIAIVILMFALMSISSGLRAQKIDYAKSSATDSKVVIHKGNRVRASSPKAEPKVTGRKSKAAAAPKENQPRFTDNKKRGAVSVSEKSPTVYTTSKRKQKRNARMRARGGE